jgi:hypothetical protein
MSFAHGLEYERNQMIAAISRRFEINSNWLKTPSTPLTDVFAPRKLIGMPVRNLHDELGWKAKKKLEDRGLCAGAIYRTDEFLSTSQDQRCGSKVGQTVHIEHTIPATMLHKNFLKMEFGKDINFRGLSWLLARSVTTAASGNQKEHGLIDNGQKKTTYCLDKNHLHFRKPFLRYSAFFKNGGKIYDVWNQKEVSPNSFTIESHFCTLVAIVRHCGADPAFVDAIQAAGPQI